MDISNQISITLLNAVWEGALSIMSMSRLNADSYTADKSQIRLEAASALVRQADQHPHLWEGNNSDYPFDNLKLFSFLGGINNARSV